MLHQTMNDKTEEQLAVGTSCGLFKRSFVLNPTENPSLSIEMITHLNYRTTAKAKAIQPTMPCPCRPWSKEAVISETRALPFDINVESLTNQEFLPNPKHPW
jgi:hypothetical protein